MKSLDKLADEINNEISLNLCGTQTFFGFVKAVKRGEENLWVDKYGKAVFFDDRYDHTWYHRISGDTVFTEIQRGGKAKVFKASTPVDLIIFSNYRDIEEYVASKISQVFTLAVNRINYDSYKNFKNETNKIDFDFNNKYVIVVNYQALYYTDKCFAEECEKVTTIS